MMWSFDRQERRQPWLMFSGRRIGRPNTRKTRTAASSKSVWKGRGPFGAQVPARAGGAAGWVGGGGGEEGGAGRRAQPRGIHRRNSRAARAPGDVPARRTHPGREEHSLGQELQRRWDVQERRRAEEALRGSGHQ